MGANLRATPTAGTCRDAAGHGDTPCHVIGFKDGEQAAIDAAIDAAMRGLLARLQGEYPALATAGNYPGLFRKPAA